MLQFEMFGSDTIQTEVKIPSTSHVSTENAAGMAMGIQVTTLTLEDAEAVKRLPNIRDNYSMLMGQEMISYAGETRQTLIWGADAGFSNVDKTEVVEGRFFTDEEDLLAVVYRSIKASVNGYNEMLRENSLPLTLCKILVRQRDNIQDTMRVFERDNILID